jgi:hypothetical protein
MHWLSLHHIRNQNFRKNSGLPHEDRFEELLSIEKRFAQNFKYFFRYQCSDREFFITSDNPVIDFWVSSPYRHLVRVLTWSPHEAFVFSPIDSSKPPRRQDVSFPTLINTLLYGSCYKEVYSSKKDVDVQSYVENLDLWNTDYRLQNMSFEINIQNTELLEHFDLDK